MMIHTTRLILMIITALLLAGCDGTLPAVISFTTPGAQPTYLVSATAQDIAAVDLPTENMEMAAQALPSQTTPVPPSEAGGILTDKRCDLVSPGMPFDVSVPDGARFLPGEPFTKTWRLINTGSCTWTRDYAVVWFSGESMGVDQQWHFASDVAPGDSIDITVDMVAPMQTGAFQSNWKIRNGTGELFGLGPNGDAPFWVIIEVRAENTATVPVQPTPVPTLAVHASGIINLVERDGVDLDTGEVNLEESIDLRYEVGGGGEIQLVPQNGASISLFGDNEPVEEDCQSANLRTAPLTVAGAETGVYLCYQTTQGLPGFAHVISAGEDGQMLALDFITWTVP